MTVDPDHALLAAVLLVLVVLRAFELALDRVHMRRLAVQGARRIPHDGLAWIVLGQTLLVVGMFAEGFLAPSSWGAPRAVPALLVLVVAAVALRYWCILTLGHRWTIRVIVPPGGSLVRRGPYRFLRHPNYLAVAVEALALPLAFELYLTAILVAATLLPALVNRIRRENRALDENIPRQTT